jgi:PHD/YefM family antitoxin component YafN of YafNO toxin-antitoxin module
LRQLNRDGEPIVVERCGRPAAALISLKDFQERFVDRTADDARRRIVARLDAIRFKTPKGKTTLDLLRALRSGRE